MENERKIEARQEDTESLTVPDKHETLKKSYESNPVVSFEEIASNVAAAKQLIDQSAEIIDADNEGNSVIIEKGEEESVSYVKEAEKIMEEDKNNPYREEQDVEGLQKKYLKSLGVDVKK